MPYANNKGVKIYYEVEGQGPPLVLAHGAGGAIERWRTYGYADALKHDFKLILFDARGHGRSDKPHEASAYTFNLMAEDVMAILDELGIGEAHYLGYSMGAKIGFRIAAGHAPRFRSFILGGQHPYRIPAASAQDNVARYKTLVTDPEAFLMGQEKTLGRALTKEERNATLANDAEALVACLTAFGDWFLTDEEVLLISVPCLLYYGELDRSYARAKEIAGYLRNATFVSLPGLDHMPGFVRSDMALPHIKKFLARVSKNQR